jgi:hypothetical protein
MTLVRIANLAVSQTVVGLGAFIGSAEAGDRWRAAIWEDDTCRSLLTRPVERLRPVRGAAAGRTLRVRGRAPVALDMEPASCI